MKNRYFYKINFYYFSKIGQLFLLSFGRFDLLHSVFLPQRLELLYLNWKIFPELREIFLKYHKTILLQLSRYCLQKCLFYLNKNCKLHNAYFQQFLLKEHSVSWTLSPPSWWLLMPQPGVLWPVRHLQKIYTSPAIRAHKQFKQFFNILRQ